MIFGLLTRSAQFVKCASGGAFIPRLFAHSYLRGRSQAGSCLEVAEWKGGKRPLEAALFAEADCVVAQAAMRCWRPLAKWFRARRASLVTERG